MGCPAVMTVKLKEYLQIIYIFQIFCSHLYYDLMEMCLLTKLRLCFDWFKNCGDFFHRELVKFVFTILKRNISPLKLQMSMRMLRLPVISPNGNSP